MRSVTPWFSLSRHEDPPTGAEPPTTPPAGGEPDPAAPVAMTQQQLDAIIADRLRRQKAQFGDYDDLKAKAEKFDAAEAANKSELEREREARTKAETERDEAARRSAERLAAAELKAALTGITDDPGDIIDDLNLAKYITADGEVDTDAVAKTREKYAALKPTTTTPPPTRPQGDIDQGRQGGTPTDMRTADEAVVKAELAKYGLRPRR